MVALVSHVASSAVDDGCEAVKEEEDRSSPSKRLLWFPNIKAGGGGVAESSKREFVGPCRRLDMVQFMEFMGCGVYVSTCYY